MFTDLPETAAPFMAWHWFQIEPFFRDLLQRKLQPASLDGWLSDWSHLSRLTNEAYNRHYVATTANTQDSAAQQAYEHYLDEIHPHVQSADQELRQKLLESGLEPPAFAVPLRKMRADAELFCPENLPLLSEEVKLNAVYDGLVGAQAVEWQGEQVTLSQLQPVLLSHDRPQRERAWRLSMERWLADREAIDDLWIRLLNLRLTLAHNAGQPDYRAYRWQQLSRFDYTPQDCSEFHQAIETVVVPAARRILEKRRRRLGLSQLRPWDLNVDPFDGTPLKPYTHSGELLDKCGAIFTRLDPAFGHYLAQMQQEGLLDLDNRPAKAPGGYCIDFPMARRPFIFANLVGLHEDVLTLLHEGGHAFHTFESSRWPYFQQTQVPMEFNEVASMGMELLAETHLGDGFYTPADAARAMIQHLEQDILFWPYMAVVDSFQHWVYTHPDRAARPAACDAAWAQLWERFMPVVDWSGLDDYMKSGWHRKLHIHQQPFYYIEYGLAQLGAMQVWRNALRDGSQAVVAYRRALALGGTETLPALYAAAGARFAFDADTLRQVVPLVEEAIADQEARLAGSLPNLLQKS